mmetsp:Transcript_4666/g.10051  ORF Transcript_4666/g.10051 Transcript_4666/m.10051 type:complete len:180 (-) Transcript_4666:170-709(-)
MSPSPSKPRLIHESLNDVSQSIRFLAVGVLSQIIFMTVYNFLLLTFEPRGYPASTIYALFYTSYIPVGHALMSLFVFGWPVDYLPSLMSNAPIGLTAMAIGTALTGFLSKIEFDALVEDWVSSTFGTAPHDHSEDEGEFYASLVVMAVTGVWSYVMSLYVNAAKPAEKGNGDKDPAKEL